MVVRLTLFPESITFCKRKYRLLLSSCVDRGRRDFLLSRTQGKLACLAGHPPDGFGKVMQNKGHKSKRKRPALWVWALPLSPQTLILIVCSDVCVLVSLLSK